jgi:hypothetical protein
MLVRLGFMAALLGWLATGDAGHAQTSAAGTRLELRQFRAYPSDAALIRQLARPAKRSKSKAPPRRREVASGNFEIGGQREATADPRAGIAHGQASAHRDSIRSWEWGDASGIHGQSATAFLIGADRGDSPSAFLFEPVPLVDYRPRTSVPGQGHDTVLGLGYSHALGRSLALHAKLGFRIEQGARENFSEIADTGAALHRLALYGSFFRVSVGF